MNKTRLYIFLIAFTVMGISAIGISMLAAR
jgi:hypothetical protein